MSRILWLFKISNMRNPINTEIFSISTCAKFQDFLPQGRPANAICHWGSLRFHSRGDSCDSKILGKAILNNNKRPTWPFGPRDYDHGCSWFVCFFLKMWWSLELEKNAKKNIKQPESVCGIRFSICFPYFHGILLAWWDTIPMRWPIDDQSWVKTKPSIRTQALGGAIEHHFTLIYFPNFEMPEMTGMSGFFGDDQSGITGNVNSFPKSFPKIRVYQ